MNEFLLNGGAYVGNTKVSKPFAALKADTSVLKINLGLLGQLFFNADDIVQIEYASSIAGSGIKIIHNVSSYPKRVMFTANMPYNDIIENIKATGFFNKTANNQVQYYQVKKMQGQGRIPFKTAAIAAFLAGWNIPFITGLVQEDVSRTFSYSRFSILFLFLMAALTLFSAPFQTLVLKEDRQINDMKRSLYFILLLTLISSIMVTVISSKAIIK
ncbi:hypothetical protein DIU31_001375 [Mucilaginibacter rubeus]|uniref:Uncharacterized protein n=1 Tax=Mucilaginibacter rubeus TaxID=2027860 RepID=A0AAE6JAS1_9SPHI|nr:MULTISPECIES: hypothetical protein [Mucilaginibacter]QEM02234.1 hypothetical protein DIU31_001375 [Mucilaginibacter rubeus]QEM14860.1 hypothetical protein DIU38_001400 [Mucilaginibacter gossypii]QTE42427.1 hypothetical protein J3L19_26415 [Mucilaginibacter rubeus]QTE49030.1 hypothetical protein J3L21_26390 [Mucilaginibacter rubeus]QTE54128.1 hypothetical protein J3L23_18015 [Mucilaginibacter rubeus]